MRSFLSILALVAMAGVGFVGAASAETMEGASASPVPAAEGDQPAQPAASTAPEPAREKVPPDCRERADEFHRILKQHLEKHQAAEKAFFEDYEAARTAFAQDDHTQADREAFAKKWADLKRQLYEQGHADLVAAMEAAGLGACFAKYDSEKSPAVHSERPQAKSSTEKKPMDEGARAIMIKCEARARDLRAAWSEHHARTSEDHPAKASTSDERKRPSAAESPEADKRSNATLKEGSSTNSKHPMDERSGDDAALKEKLDDLRRLCHKEMQDHLHQKESNARFGSCTMFTQDGLINVECKHIRLVGIPEEQAMTKIQVRDTLYVDRLYAKGFLATFEPQQTKEGSAIQVFDASKHRVMGIHDSPKGIINLAASDEVSAFVLDLADDLKVERYDEGLRFSDGKHRGAVVLHEGSLDLSDGNIVLVTGKATFFVGEPSQEDSKLGDAIAKKRVGAEVALAKDGKNDTVTIGDGFDVHELTIAGSGFTAKVDSEDGKCKTVVFKLEAGLLAGALDKLDVKVTDIAVTGAETSMHVQMASDIEDVLDPCDDGPETVEFWTVSDANGVQVLVSIPHFSEKRIEVASTDALGSLVPGFQASFVLAAFGVATVLIGVRRRT